MTGIERLRKLSEDLGYQNLWDALMSGREDDWDCEEYDGKTLSGTIAAITAQIEREADVETVRSDAMEAWRWVRRRGGLATLELHEETFADLMRQRDEYRDLARGYERDATWVREHGGLERVSLDFVEGMAFGDIVDDIAARLGISVAGLDSQDARDRIMPLLDRRLMPEGIEWPRYESGEPVVFGDDVSRNGEDFEVKAIALYCDGSFSLNSWAYSKGERVKRHAPKVYDADGVEIREGDRVWSTHLDEPHEWIVIDPHEDRGDSQTVLVSIGDRTGHARPEDLTHRAPVLAADGEPLKAGQTVWDVESGKEYEVVGIHADEDSPVRVMRTDGSHLAKATKPDTLTHQRPVLDADGVPIKKGDTVYLLPGEWCGEWPCLGFHGGEELVVTDLHPNHQSGGIRCAKTKHYEDCYPQPSQLTHTKPEPPDSRERVEEDAKKDNCEYFGYAGKPCYGCPAFDMPDDCGSVKGADIVRRCKALAERERSE